MSDMPVETKKVSVPEVLLDKTVVFWATLTIVAFIAVSFIIPEGMETLLKRSLRVFGESTGIFYQLSIVFVLLSVLYFACSRYGEIRFGAEGEKPEFSTFDWAAMVFCTCMAGGTIYWAAMEPLMHMKEVPFSWVQQDTDAAALYGMAFMLLRPWWIWGLNVLAALPVCYLIYIKKIPLARFTEILEPILGEKIARGPVGKIANIIFVVAIMFSYAGGIAVSIPLAGACLAYVIGIEHTLFLDLLVLGLCSMLYVWSSYQGLNGGIRVLSRLNVYLCFFLAGFIMLFGPTMFILNHMSFSFGLAFDNFWAMLLCKDPYWNGVFPTDWAQFQILWNYSSAPLLAMFIARVSRGRTVREIITMGMACGIVGLYMNYGVVGCYSLWVQHTGLVDLESIMQTQSKATALIALLNTLPFAKFMMLFVLFFIAIFSATSIDSCALVASGACCREIGASQDPPRSNRIYWALIQGSLGLTYMMIGGLTACRVLGSYSGVLMGILLFIAYAAWYKYAREYRQNLAGIR